MCGLVLPPNLRRVGEDKASKMGRRDLDDGLAEQGRGPLRGGAHAVDRVLDVRRVGSGLQVLVRWRGMHEDQWLPYADCNPVAQKDAKLLERRKLPQRRAAASGAGKLRVHPKFAGEGGKAVRQSSRLGDGGGLSGPAARRITLAYGREVPRRWLSPVIPRYSPGGVASSPAFGVGAGRSARGLPIVIDSRGADELRGALWQTSPGAVRAAGVGRGRKRSGLAEDAIAKRRREGT